MESATRDEIGASAAAHAELGRDYDHAVAEGLIERIGAEIDRRVDARIARPGGGIRYRSRRPGTLATLVMGLGSTALGVGATSIVLNNGQSMRGTTAAIVLLVLWAAIGFINWTFINRK